GIFGLRSTPTGWKYKILAFLPQTSNLQAGLLIGKGGVLYGTASMGGSGICDSSGYNYGCGFVFQLTQSKGLWNMSVIYNFQGAPKDGASPYGEVVTDTQGNLYGTTMFGGSGPCAAFLNGCGTLFRLVRSNGTWKNEILHNFVGG